MDVNAFYTNRIIEIQKREKSATMQLRLFGSLRLAAFIVIIVAAFVVIPRNLSWGIILLTMSTILFFWLIRRYHNINLHREHLRHLIRINKEEKESLAGNYSFFANGSEFEDPGHPFSYDMDLFGDGSVFQYLNRSSTTHGKDHLAGLLTEHTGSFEVIRRRQDAIKELSEHIELLQDFRATGNMYPDAIEDVRMLQHWIREPVYFLKKKPQLLMARILPVLTLLSVPAAIFIPGMLYLLAFLFFTQLYLISRQSKRTGKEYQPLSSRLNALRKYARLLEHIENIQFNSADLQEISGTLTRYEYAASRAIRNLSRIVAAFDSRLNILVAIFLEGFFLWDIQCLIRLEKWRTSMGSHFDEWMSGFARFDGLASLANFAFNNPDFIYPEFTEDTIIEAKHLGHILISPEERICNDFSISGIGDFVIVTGANMAGKSTFLRTVATNMILAMSGAPVCAEKFRMRPLKLFSSMRTSDSLNKHESYFYAELKRLKEMLDRLRSGEELFILLDEILKGTNSTDKQKGSMAALEQILRYNGTGIIATHDLALAAAENDHPDKIKNYCFEIEIDEAVMHFDYKLRKGITTRMNASLLMQQMGIIG